MAEFIVIFQPFIDLFNQDQVQTILLAWLPTKLESYLSGIMVVDMFLTTMIASGVTTLFAALYLLSCKLTTGSVWNKNVVTVQVEHYVPGIYGGQHASTFYEALSWIISQQTKKLSKGSFLVQPTNSDQNDDDDCTPPDFNILPEKNQLISIEYKGKKFDVTYNMPESDSENKENSNNNNNGFNASNGLKPMPSIYLTTAEDSNTSVNAISDFLNMITRAYLESQKELRVRSRYERSDEYWYKIQALSSNRGLETVVLDKPQEQLIKKELNTFTSDKEFYNTIGIPYRRGILLYGKPGTGKTSLINAISSQLNRDLYFLNLKNVTSDNELNASFSSIPANQIVVLEDIDTQSKVLHKRAVGTVDVAKKGTEGNSGGKLSTEFASFSLSTFLGCLDGHIMSEGNFIIMTTNHVELLDPACIRPGRMDVHLDLEYCTHYQIKKMYKNITDNPKAEFPQEILAKIPEKLLPPCEVMMTMILYRKEIDKIPEKVFELTHKYQNMKPEEIAKQMEDELRRIDAASVNNEELNTDGKDEVMEVNGSDGDGDGDKIKSNKDEIDKNNDEIAEARKNDSKDGVIIEKEMKEKIKKIDSAEMIRTLSDSSTVVDENNNEKCVR